MGHACYDDNINQAFSVEKASHPFAGANLIWVTVLRQMLARELKDEWVPVIDCTVE